MPRTTILKQASNTLSETSNDLPWRTSLESTQTSIKNLDKEFQEALNELKGRQRKFVLKYVSGTMSAEEAVIKSGYSASRPSQQVSRLLRNELVVRAFNLGRIAFQLKHGIDSRWKRQKLVDLYIDCTTKGSDEWNPMAATKCMALLQSMDGDGTSQTSKSGSSGVNIVINTGVPEQKVVVESGSIVDAEPEE